MEREKLWRISIGLLCASFFLIFGLEIYLIKRLEDPKPKPHVLREIRNVRVTTQGRGSR
jgi:hypothetical protein